MHSDSRPYNNNSRQHASRTLPAACPSVCGRLGAHTPKTTLAKLSSLPLPHTTNPHSCDGTHSQRSINDFTTQREKSGTRASVEARPRHMVHAQTGGQGTAGPLASGRLATMHHGSVEAIVWLWQYGHTAHACYYRAPSRSLSEIVRLHLAAEMPRRAAEEEDVDGKERVVSGHDEKPIPRKDGTRERQRAVLRERDLVGRSVELRGHVTRGTHTLSVMGEARCQLVVGRRQGDAGGLAHL